jgi:hypothetical protein
MYKMTLIEIAEEIGYKGNDAIDAAHALACNGYAHLEDEEHTRAEWNNIIDALREEQ